MNITYLSKLRTLAILLSLSVNISAATAAAPTTGPAAPPAASTAVPAAHTTTDLTAGIASFNGADYAAAIVRLTRAVNSEPINATAHYYLACAYQRSGKVAYAIAEYKLAHTFDHQGTIAKYATTALAACTASGSASTAAIISPTQQAVDQISRQAQVGQSLIRDKSSAHATASKITGSYEEQQLAQTRDATVKRMQNSYYTDADGNSYPVYTKAQIEAVKADYDQRISTVDRFMKDDIQKHLDFGSQTTSALNDSVTGLQSLLQPGAAGHEGVQLLPNGTNLFVRNYAAASSATSTAPKSELKASPQQLILTPHSQQKKPDWQVVPAAETADQDKLLLHEKQKGTELKVHGEVVPGHGASP